MFSVSDEDSDSSVSLLLDENEVREIVDKEFDSVKIPPCFIPNADMTKGKLNFFRFSKILSFLTIHSAGYKFKILYIFHRTYVCSCQA